jgi:hypothetical protein
MGNLKKNPKGNSRIRNYKSRNEKKSLGEFKAS